MRSEVDWCGMFSHGKASGAAGLHPKQKKLSLRRHGIRTGFAGCAQRTVSTDGAQSAPFVVNSAFPVWLWLGRAVLAVGAVLLVLPVGIVSAQETQVSGQPPEVQVVQTKELTVITLAGVGPQDKDGKLVAPGDFAGQFEQTWNNLRRLMVSAGSPLKNIVSITVYTTDAKWQDSFKELQQDSFSDWNPATSFAVAQQLRTPGALLEIHAVAVINKGRPARR